MNNETVAILTDGIDKNIGGIALMNRVREITKAVMQLASAKFTTGVIMPVDGGYVHGSA